MISNRKIYWLLLFAVGLAALLWPCSMLAQAEKTDMTLNIVYDGFSSLKAGETRTVFLEVGNSGDRELTDIRLTSDSPQGWTVAFNPQVIDKLAAGDYQTVDITLKPADNEAKGDYNIAVIAQANEMRRVTSIYVRVESSSLFWVWVGAGVAALLIIGFIVIFMKFGREDK